MTSSLYPELFAWANEFFSPDARQTDQLIALKRLRILFFASQHKPVNQPYTTQRFVRGLQCWCKLNGYQYNPKSLANKSGDIVRQGEEFVYVQSGFVPINIR